MRPKSIVWFERLLLATIATMLIIRVNEAPTMLTKFAANPITAPFGTAIFICAIGFNLFINLMFWFFIARRAINIAKWIWVVLIAIGLPYNLYVLFTGLFAGVTSLGTIVFQVISACLEVAAAVMLFRPDAKVWFANRGQNVDPSVFD